MPSLSSGKRLRIVQFTFLAHLVGVISMALIARGLPPQDLQTRYEFVAGFPWRWRLVWVVWMTAAFSLVLFYIAWRDTLPERYKVWGLAAVGLAAAGCLVDWVAEITAVTLVPEWAEQAINSPFYAELFRLWSQIFMTFSPGVANLLYGLGGIILTIMAGRERFFPRWLLWWSILLWAVTLLLSLVAFINNPLGVLVATALTFSLLLPWLLLIGYGWLIAARPQEIGPEMKERLSFSGVAHAIVPRHPVAMETIFRECYLVNFAVAPEVLAQALPDGFSPAVHNGKGYVSLVIAITEDMRPAGLSRLFGLDYNQVVYRAVVEHQGQRGFYYLRSDADSRLICLAGNWFSFFQFQTADISYRAQGELRHFNLEAQNGDKNIYASYDLASKTTEMPAVSHFAALEEAKSFLVEIFEAFGYDPLSERTYIIKVKRGPWDIAVIEDGRAYYPYMANSPLIQPGSAELDSVFYVRDLPYYWYRLR